MVEASIVNILFYTIGVKCVLLESHCLDQFLWFRARLEWRCAGGR